MACRAPQPEHHFASSLASDLYRCSLVERISSPRAQISLSFVRWVRRSSSPSIFLRDCSLHSANAGFAAEPIVDTLAAMPGKEHLCGVCRPIFNDLSLRFRVVCDSDDRVRVKKRREFDRNPWHQTLSSLLHSQSKGCFLCSDLWSKSRDLGMDEDIQNFATSTWGFGTGIDSASDADEDIEKTRLWLHLDVYDDADDPLMMEEFEIEKSRKVRLLPDASAGAGTSSSTSDESVGKLARWWLEQCVHHHPECNLQGSSHFFPTRLLSLSAGRIRLIDAVEELSSRPEQPYATLSHCWGKSAKMSNGADGFVYYLADDTELLLREGLDVSSLPQTFQDAIVTVERIGLSLVWIDCYCIKQRGSGSEADKARELASMEDVYGNALVNIGATAAASSTEGCFRSRDLSSLEPLEFQWKATAMHQRSSYYIRSRGEMSWLDFHRQPLMTRGWVLQERMLCRRMIHFTAQQIQWECNSTQWANEIWPHGLPDSDIWEFGHPFSVIQSSELGQASPIDTFSAKWWRIVEMYSQMNLSMPNDDKLVAIGGIAKRFAGLHKIDYSAGMWMQTLHDDLLWRIARDEKQPAGKSAPKWRAPSWSWASTDLPVLQPWSRRHVDEEIHRTHTSVVHVSTELLHTTNPYGALASASLTLRGRLLHSKVRNALPMTGWLDVRTRDNADVRVVLDDPSDETENIGLFILDSSRYGSSDPAVGLEGLALSSLAGGLYKRIGLFSVPRDRIYSSAMRQDEEEVTIV